MSNKKAGGSKSGDLDVSFLESNAKRNVTTKFASKRDSLHSLAEQDKALFLTLDELNDKDLAKLKDFLDSLDHEPIFIAHDQATCD